MDGDVRALELGGTDGVAPVRIGADAPLTIIAGPCVLESEGMAHEICSSLVEICERAGLQLVFKASFDKANRTSSDAFRGPGIHDGLDMLRRVRGRHGVPVTTDVHLPDQASTVAEAVDLLQIPAFLCRQTDLLQACGRTGRPVNLKKGQFQAPWDMGPAVGKVHEAGAASVLVTERGASFGYNNLVADMRSLPALRALGVPVCFDATHSVQLPGAQGDGSGGDRKMAPVLARAAVAAGVDAVFMEVHPRPQDALSDAATMLPLAGLETLLQTLADLHRIVSSSPTA